MTHSAIKADYPFLVHPPPRKGRIPAPLPLESVPTHTARRRSSTFSAIAAWASHVQPGTPASLSPCSPPRRSSLGKGRRPSITSIRPPSASFLHITPTPITAHQTTPSIRDFKADLTTVGYTSVFLQLPNTPISATLSFAVKPPSPSAVVGIPVPPVPSPACNPRGLTRFRSLSSLRSRGRSKSVSPDSPTKMKVKATAAIVKRKKAKYAVRPPPLTNELVLMQFADGGSMDDNVKRVMQLQAKATGTVGLADVYRDGKGGIWWDQDEEWEYTHLLAEGDDSRPRACSDLQWVTFRNNTSPSAACMPGDERRGSVSTQDSDLDPKYMVQPVDLLDGDDSALFGSAIVPVATCQPSMSVLALPSRPRRAAKHLHKPDYLVDVAFSSRLHASLPKSSKFSPTSPGTGAGTTNSMGKARRRPAPLKLSPPSPAFKLPTNSPIDVDRARRDFFETSFVPVPASVTRSPAGTPATIVSPTTPVDTRKWRAGHGRTMAVGRSTGAVTLGVKKPFVLNMMGLFRSGRKHDVMC